MNNPCHNKVTISMTLLASCVPGIVANMGSASKLQRVMKLTAVLLTACCLQVSAYSGAQVSFSGKDVRLDVVFQAIGKQTGYIFLYSPADLKDTKPVTIDVKNVSIETIMKKCLEGQPLEFTIADKTVFVKRVKQKNTTNDYSLTGNVPIEVLVRVTNEESEPVAGVTVQIKGGKVAGATDGDGVAKVKVESDAILLLTAVNILPEEIRIDGRKEIDIQVKGKTGKLDEVQVIAYGTSSQRLTTGNVATVKASDIAKQPVNNPLLALQGRVPGLIITQSNGLQGSGVIVRIQGQNSLRNGNDPLYVIDGVPYTSQLLPNLGGILLGKSGGAVNGSGASFGGGNPLSYINPSDIESIDVLKDADATAIYGSRAANGAILITTKKGKVGQTKVDINMQSGWGKVTRKIELLNTQQYLEMRHEAFKNDGETPNIDNAPDLLLWDTTRYTDWQKTLIGGTAHYTNAQASISGGNAIIQYLVNAGYHRETTVFPSDYSDQKGSLHFNINSGSINRKFRFQLSGSYLVDNNKLPRTDLTGAALTIAPNAPPIYDITGSLNWEPNANGSSTFYNNPLAYLFNTYKNKTKNLIANTILSYKIFSNLEIKSSFGYTALQSNEVVTEPLLSTPPEFRSNTLRSAQYVNNTISTWIIEPQVNYKQSIGKGKLEAMAGVTFQQTNSNGQQLNGSGYNSDLVLEDIKSAVTVIVQSSIASIYKYNALFGRLNYSWKDKYIMNFTARRDGSSRFGAANKFQNFGAAGVAWIFSSEAFIKKGLPIVSFGKLRGSYGITGNDQIGDYNFLNLYTPPSGVGVAYQATTGLLPNGLTNPYLQWEKTKKLQFGLDLGLLKDRILININYFHNRSSNQLLRYNLPITSGFPFIIKNFPATIQNSGLELSLNTVNIKSKSFTWSNSVNVTIPRNKLVSFPNIATSSLSNLIVGQPINILRVYHLIGVDDATGEYQFADSHGNPTANPSFPTDATTLINTEPKFYGGVQNSFSFKGFQLDIFFQFVKQIALNYEFGLTPGVNYNQPISVLNRWRKPGDHRSIQRYNQDYSLINQFAFASGSSDAAFSDASYLRLKNLSLSWQLPESLKKIVHLQNCKLYIQGQNLLTITSYKKMDPENQSIGSLPPLKVLTLGFQIGF